MSAETLPASTNTSSAGAGTLTVPALAPAAMMMTAPDKVSAHQTKLRRLALSGTTLIALFGGTIGLWAAKRVHNSKDYVVAGRSVPLFMSMALVFATWFGAETVLGVSATFLNDGLGGIVADPFGFSFCLVIIALFFARAFYRLNLLTIGDFYRHRYNKPVEIATSICITLSYLGWVAAQLTALGLVFHTLSGGAISLGWGIALGTGVVLLYTLFGGMWSVALTDLFQSVVIVAGPSGSDEAAQLSGPGRRAGRRPRRSPGRRRTPLPH